MASTSYSASRTSSKLSKICTKRWSVRFRGSGSGVAFCEASGPRLVRTTGTDPALVDLATRNVQAIGCGHAFLVVLGNAYPVNVLDAVRRIPEVCRIYCATANPLEVIVAETGQGRGVLGVVDGEPPLGVEGPDDVAARHGLLRKIGYKL